MIYNRRDIVVWLMKEMGISEQEAIQIMRKMSDEDICNEFKMTLIRKGWYAR